jgi:hypothetical protein
MTRITVDAATAAKLHGVGQFVELCDEAGNVLGHFAPDEKSPAFREWLRNLDPGLSQEEIQGLIARREGIPTQELIARLRSRTP